MGGIEDVAARFATPAVHWIALLGLCAAYLQGGLNKATDFNSDIVETKNFGLAPAMPFAVTAILELVASVLILIGFCRWLGALAVAGFTLMATLTANRFWKVAPPERTTVANTFFEHLGLRLRIPDRPGTSEDRKWQSLSKIVDVGEWRDGTP
jgi:uncharacterized membrane protein YphA (DoxX/SURF4 family)